MRNTVIRFGKLPGKAKHPDCQMFMVQFRRDYDTPNDYQVEGYASTVVEAAKLRVVSGDLVCDAFTGEIVSTTSLWLWPWERTTPNSYAQKAIRWQRGAR